MTCPHCHKTIDNALLASELGKVGGKKSRRTLTREQAQAMQRAKKKTDDNKKKQLNVVMPLSS